MNRSRIRRLVGVTAAAALTLAALGAGPVAAKTPTWFVTFDSLPNVVAPGNHAGWEVMVENRGTSNINALTATVTAETGAQPTYYSLVALSSGGTGSCAETTGALVCSVGTLAAGDSATFVVAFEVPATASGAFDINVALRAGTGDTPADGPGKSRGDAIDFDGSTPISQSSNFDGGFIIQNGEATFSTNQSLGRRNIQATSLDAPDDLIGVTIEDGITSGVSCESTVNAQCGRLFGEWSSLNVNDGANYPGTPFKVTLLILGSTVPGGTSAEDIVVVHVLDIGTIDVIGDTPDEICASANTPPATGECIFVTKVGGNYQIVVYLLKNGNLRGGF